MNKISLLLLALFLLAGGISSAQNYDTVSGATQKADGKMMNLEQFTKALQIKKKKLVFSTVNGDGTPNAAVYGSFMPVEENVFAVNSMADTKTTKANVMRDNLAILLLVLDEKTDDGFDGAKVVLNCVSDSDKIAKYRLKLEKSSERTTFFTVEKFLVYH